MKNSINQKAEPISTMKAQEPQLYVKENSSSAHDFPREFFLTKSLLISSVTTLLLRSSNKQ